MKTLKVLLFVIVMASLVLTACGAAASPSEAAMACGTLGVKTYNKDGSFECNAAAPAQPTVAPEPTQATEPTKAPEPTKVPEPTAASTQPADTSVDKTNVGAGSWEEVEFKPTGDIKSTYNVDHAGKVRITISWYYAAAGTDLSAKACTMHVTTDKSGERITLLGAYRTFEWSGSSVAPTPADYQKLVADWVKVLESEPRGECAKAGAYSVTWQDQTLAP